MIRRLLFMKTKPARSDISGGSVLAHMPAIDGLRGIAILLVLIHHFTPQVSGPYWTRRALEAAHTGWIGVDLFFVLSGFLITAILLKTRKSEDYFLNFYARRTLRIFPVYYLTLVVLFLVVPVLLQTPILGPFVSHYFGKVIRDLPDLIQNQSWLWLYGTNLKVATEGERWGVVNHFWSLAVEEHFYLIWPLVVWFVSSRGQLIRICLVCILSAPLLRGLLMLAGFDSVVPYVLTPCRVDSLAIGALVSILITDSYALKVWTRRSRVLALGALTGLIILIAVYERFDRDDLWTTIGGYSLLAIFSAWLVLEAAQVHKGLGYRFMTNPVLTSLGRYSYGLYVTHMFFVPAYDKVFGRDLLIRWTGSYNAAILIYLVLAIACSWGIAWISYHAVEKHFLKLKMFFDYQRSPVPVSRPVSEKPSSTGPLYPNAVAISPRQAMRQAA